MGSIYYGGGIWPSGQKMPGSDLLEMKQKTQISLTWRHCEVTVTSHDDVTGLTSSNLVQNQKSLTFQQNALLRWLPTHLLSFCTFGKKHSDCIGGQKMMILAFFVLFCHFFPEYLGPTKKPPFATKTQKCDIFFQKS